MKKTLYVSAAAIAFCIKFAAFSAPADELPTCYYDEECSGYVVAGDGTGGENVGESGGTEPGPGPGPGPGPSTPNPM